MEIRFTDENFDIKNLIKDEHSGVNQFLLENNKKQLEAVFNFYNSKTPLLLVNGFLGTGKTQIINHSLQFLTPKTIVLEYNCFETTILDDILLSFFEDFKNLTMKEVISQPKIKSENFTQKIASYFNSINQPIVIIINSFESVLKTNKQEILDFLFHILKRDNIKIIVIARTFNYEDFIDKIDFERVTILALEKGLFEKYLRSEGIKLIGPVSDELYKHTRGYFLYTKLSAKIIKAHNLTLINFLDGYTKSFLSYNDFILREALAFVDPVSGHLFRLLTVLRHPVSLKLLKTINLYDEEKIKYFIENLLLSKEKDMIYLQDYYKEISQNSIPSNVNIKLHKSCVELYSTQLPLKPFERDMLISRQTMRSEIEYHLLFIPQKPQPVSPLNTTTVEALEYAADSKCNYDIPQSDEIPKPEIIKPQSKEEKIKNISFIFETEAEEKHIMDGIASSINKFIDYSNKILTPEEAKLPLMELMNRAKREEDGFNYKKAIAFYQMALTLKDDENFALMVSRIYTRIAKCYEKISDWFNALKYYDMALEYFTTAGDFERLNEMRLAIANIFYITYKHSKAEMLLNDILSPHENISNELRIKAHLALAAIKNHDIKEAYNHYKAAFELIEPVTSKKVLCELYYKFAAVCDDLDEIKPAVQLYKRCMDITKDNPYLSSAIVNLAMIFDDTGAYNLAVKYYKEGLKIDEGDKNYNGVYIAALKLAKLLAEKSPDEALEYFNKAILSAKESGEPFYIMNSNIEYGDFCEQRKEFSKALKAYMKALAVSKTSAAIEDKERIEQKIRDLKARLGDVEFNKLENEIITNG